MSGLEVPTVTWRLFVFILIVTHAGFIWPPYPAEAGEGVAVAERASADRH